MTMTTNLISRQDLKKAIKEVNEKFKIKQSLAVSTEDLSRFLRSVYIKHKEAMPKFARQVAELIPEEETCPEFGYGYNPKECQGCDEGQECRRLSDLAAKGDYDPVKRFVDKYGNVQPVNVMFDILCREPDIDKNEFEKRVKATGIDYSYHGFDLAWRMTQKVVAGLRRHRLMK